MSADHRVSHLLYLHFYHSPLVKCDLFSGLLIELLH